MVPILSTRLWQRARAQAARSTVIGITGTGGTAFVGQAVAHLLGDHYHLRHLTAATPAALAWRMLGDSASPLAAYVRLLLPVAPPQADLLILEYPLHRPGDVDTAARHIPPNVAVITALHRTRLDLFQRQALIAHEAASLLASLSKQNGTAVLNADDPSVSQISRHARRTIWYGEHAQDVRLGRTTRLAAGPLTAVVTVAGMPHELHLPRLIARHHLTYVVAALAAVHAVGADLKQAVKRAQTFTPPPHMMQRCRGRHGTVVIDDTAEATPESVFHALDTLAELPARRRLALLSAIPQLGTDSVDLHQEIGRQAARAADVVITVGEEARHMHDAAQRARARDLHAFTTAAEAATWLAPHLKTGDIVLVKMEHQPGQEAVKLLSPTDKD